MLCHDRVNTTTLRRSDPPYFRNAVKTGRRSLKSKVDVSGGEGGAAAMLRGDAIDQHHGRPHPHCVDRVQALQISPVPLEEEQAPGVPTGMAEIGGLPLKAHGAFQEGRNAYAKGSIGGNVPGVFP